MSWHSSPASVARRPDEPSARRQPSAVDAEAWVLTTEAGQPAAGRGRHGPIDRPFGPRSVSKTGSPAAGLRRDPPVPGPRPRRALKFERGQQMWVEPIGVEQATSEPVARHKATRFACPLVVDLCAGIGGDALALAARSDVLAVDLDPGMCRRIRYNASVYDVADRVLPVRARAETFAIPAGAWLHLDPDRRACGHERTRSLDDYAPGPAFWKSAVRRVAAGAIKLGPASDFAKHFAGPEYEVELISLRGECKEATVWFGELVSCRRRATRLPENVTWTDRDGPTGQWAAGHAARRVRSTIPTPPCSAPACSTGSPWHTGSTRVADGVDYLTGERWSRHRSSPRSGAGGVAAGPQAAEEA